MRTIIVLTIEDAVKAIKEGFDFAVILHDSTEKDCEPHATLLVSKTGYARKIANHGDELQISSINGFEAFRLRSGNAFSIMHERKGCNILTRVFPDIEVVGQNEWRYNDYNNVVELRYPYIHWSRMWGELCTYNMHLSENLYAYFSSREEVVEQIEWAVIRGLLDEEKISGLIHEIDNLELLATKKEARRAEEGNWVKENRRQTMVLVSSIIDSLQKDDTKPFN